MKIVFILKNIYQKGSQILELSDGSDDKDDKPIVIDSDGDTEIIDSGDEAPSETAEVHVFECRAKHCKGKGNSHMVYHYFDMSDAKSTGNLRKHARLCWGVETVAAADEA